MEDNILVFKNGFSYKESDHHTFTTSKTMRNLRFKTSLIPVCPGFNISSSASTYVEKVHAIQITSKLNNLLEEHVFYSFY